MANPRPNTPRKPATKFAQLQKKLFRLKPGSRAKPNASIHLARRGHQQRHA